MEQERCFICNRFLYHTAGDNDGKSCNVHKQEKHVYHKELLEYLAGGSNTGQAKS